MLPHRLIDKAAHFCIIRDEMVITRHFAYPDIFEWEPCFLIYPDYPVATVCSALPAYPVGVNRLALSSHNHTSLSARTCKQSIVGTLRSPPVETIIMPTAVGWLGSRVVSVLDSRAEGPGSNRSGDAVG